MYTSNEEYQKALLEFFKLDNYDEESIMMKTDLLYSKAKNLKVFKDRTEELAGSIMSTDLEMGFMLMFSYDNLDNTISMLKENNISV